MGGGWECQESGFDETGSARRRCWEVSRDWERSACSGSWPGRGQGHELSEGMCNVRAWIRDTIVPSPLCEIQTSEAIPE